jgi:hypothetical protein
MAPKPFFFLKPAAPSFLPAQRPFSCTSSSKKPAPLSIFPHVSSLCFSCTCAERFLPGRRFLSFHGAQQELHGRRPAATPLSELSSSPRPPWRPPPWRSLPAGSSFPWPTPCSGMKPDAQPWRLSSPRSASALPPLSSSAHGTAGHWRPCFPCDFHGREFPLVAISPARPLQASSDFHLPATSKAEPLLPLFGALAAGRTEPHGALISSSLSWTPRKIPQPSPQAAAMASIIFFLCAATSVQKAAAPPPLRDSLLCAAQ